MTRRETAITLELSRREFLVTTGMALAGMAAFGLVGPAAASTRHPPRSGTLLYSSRTDMAGLDAHRHNLNHAVVAACHPQ